MCSPVLYLGRDLLVLKVLTHTTETSGRNKCLLAVPNDVIIDIDINPVSILYTQEFGRSGCFEDREEAKHCTLVLVVLLSHKTLPNPQSKANVQFSQ